MNIKIPKRLKLIVDNIDKSSNTLIDIGTDHGKLPIYIAKNKIIHNIIATDISDKCLKKCKKLAIASGINNIKYIKSDGFDRVNLKKIDCVCISGMGGYEIIKILQRTSIELNQLLLMPHQNLYELRKFLFYSKFGIYEEKVVEENNKFYFLIISNSFKNNCSSKYLKYGFNTIENKTFKKYLDKLLLKKVDLINKLEDHKKAEEIKKEIEDIKEIYEYENFKYC